MASPLEHFEFRRLAEGYPHAVDGRCAKLCETIMTDASEIVGPTVHAEELDAVGGIVDRTEGRPVTWARGTAAAFPKLRSSGDPIPDMSA